ncbi:MAG: ABC transporter permease [Chloroflexi bacterium]|mgnify:CR=1 FL=1|nr:ABC transporter permease [Chloroflexota bacterium]
MNVEQEAQVVGQDRVAADAEGERIYVASQWQLIRWRFAHHKVAVFSLGVLIALYAVVLFAEFFAPYDPRRTDTDWMLAPPQRVHIFRDGRLHRPYVLGMTWEMDPQTFGITYEVDPTQVSPIYWFSRGDSYKLWELFETDLHLFGVQEGTVFLLGTDTMGRDLLSRIVHGGRLSLSVGLLGIAISFMLGITIGGFSGYFGGVFDTASQRVIEFIRSIPTLPLWMALSVSLPKGWSVTRVYFAIVVILSLVGWTGLARVVRGRFMSLRSEDFVMAARISGSSEPRIIFRHMLPSFTSHIIASLTLSIPGMILGETSLSFIGLGLQAPAISWGVLLKDAQHIRVLATAPWLLMPGAFIVIAILAFNFLGDGLRDAADPYAR